MRLRYFFASLILACSLQATANTELLPLNHRTSDDLLPIAQSFIGADGKVSAYGNQLIVNASPEKIMALRDLLSQLDTPPKRLLITVENSENASQDLQESSIKHSTQTRMTQFSTDSRQGGAQTLQVSEGTPALVQIGQSVPLTTFGSDTYGRLQTQTQYRDVTQGFYVTASLSGETVHLLISTQNNHMSPQDSGIINLRNTDTRLSGRLGEWIVLATARDEVQEQQLTRHYGTLGRGDMTLRVKVERLD